MTQAVTVGDVFAFPLPSSADHGVCQVLAVADAGDVVVAALDWRGAGVPALDQLVPTRRLIRDFMFWRPEELRHHVSLPVPADYQLLGNLPVAGDTDSRSYGDWSFGYALQRQRWWNALPTELTTRFKAAIDSDEPMVTAGLIDPDTGEPQIGRVGSTDRFSDRFRYRLADDFTMASLASWPLLNKVTLHTWRDDLVPFLADSPLVGTLELTGHGQSTLDLSTTQLTELTVELAGLEYLQLPDQVRTLTLQGVASGPIRVQANGGGAAISLHLDGAVPPLTGLERLRELRLRQLADLDLAAIVGRFPGLRELRLWGAPGLLHGLEELTGLSELNDVWMFELFGYDDFPGPRELPAVDHLWLESLPAQAAAAIKRKYRGSGVELRIRKPRKPDWLEENLENPLRSWDGREGIPAAAAKRARLAYITALKQVRAAEAESEPGRSGAITDAISTLLGVIQQLNAKHHFL